MVSISKIRRVLYKSEKLLGDMDAIRKGRFHHRVKNRAKARIVSKIVNKFLK